MELHLELIWAGVAERVTRPWRRGTDPTGKIMLIFFVFPVALLFTSIVWTRSVWKAGSVSGASSAATTLLAALMLSYVSALVQISLDPWFDDNGAPEFIAWQPRWGWAAILAGWYMIVTVPLAFGFRSLVRLLNNRP